MGFDKDFVWGAATSSYQIEGAAYEDGKGLSIWDEFCKEPDRIFEGHTGDVACDHYHRYLEDVALMAEMGLKAYRFSISWLRVMPSGTGAINEKGLAFYSELVDALLRHGITPYVTLFHWDYPAALQQRGGWLNPESPAWFEAYTEAVVGALGDRVKHWVTLNEPQMVVGNAFLYPNMAPGIKMTERDAVRMIHHLLLAHGRSVQAIRRLCADSAVGYAPCSGPAIPVGQGERDVEAARQYYFATDGLDKLAWGVTWYSDPVLLGRYPADGLALYERYLPDTWRDDLRTIHQPLDFYGQNLYSGDLVARGEDGKPVLAKRPPGYAKTAIDWPVDPQCLYYGPKFLYERYQLPIVITENGMSCHDTVSLDGQVHDPNRIDFLHRYLLELRRAAADGVKISGYFQWSLMDNFEWGKGYHERFGLIYVDFATQRRILKDSAAWYRQVMETNGECL